MKCVKAIISIVAVLTCIGCCKEDEYIRVNFVLHENHYLNYEWKQLEDQLGIPDLTRDLVLTNGWLCFARQRKCNLGMGASVREQVFHCGKGTQFVWLCETNRVWRVVYDVLVPNGISL